MKKGFFAFACICVYVLGTIGGIGYSIWGGSWPVAIAVALLAAMAFPFIRERWKEL